MFPTNNIMCIRIYSYSLKPRDSRNGSWISDTMTTVVPLTIKGTSLWIVQPENIT